MLHLHSPGNRCFATKLHLGPKMGYRNTYGLGYQNNLKSNTFNIINEKNETISEFVGQFLTTHLVSS